MGQNLVFVATNSGLIYRFVLSWTNPSPTLLLEVLESFMDLGMMTAQITTQYKITSIVNPTLLLNI